MSLLWVLSVGVTKDFILWFIFIHFVSPLLNPLVNVYTFRIKLNSSVLHIRPCIIPASPLHELSNLIITNHLLFPNIPCYFMLLALHTCLHVGGRYLPPYFLWLAGRQWPQAGWLLGSQGNYTYFFHHWSGQPSLAFMTVPGFSRAAKKGKLQCRRTVEVCCPHLYSRTISQSKSHDQDRSVWEATERPWIPREAHYLTS